MPNSYGESPAEAARREEGLSREAERLGRLVARKLFEARGNHSEAHLSEAELAQVCALAAEVMRQTCERER